MKKAYFMLNREFIEEIYSKNEINRIEKLVNISDKLIIPDSKGNVKNIHSDCKIILSVWQVKIDKDFLVRTSNLEVVFYGAESIRDVVTDEFWKSNVVITSSWAANAVPVAEYTLVQIIIYLKNAYYHEASYKKQRDRSDITAVLDVTYPEPPISESQLFYMPNVILTPHIAGSMDSGCNRMRSYANDEIERFPKGKPLKFQITHEMFNEIA